MAERNAPAGAPPPAEQTDRPVRDRLLSAAARVFARKGYDGTRVMDVVREAGLSTGAIYGRFSSKNDLLRAAIVERAVRVRVDDPPPERVADLIERLAVATHGPLRDDEAVRLEAFVAARREPEIAAAIAEAGVAWRAAVQPLVDAARADGTVGRDVDPEAVLHLVRTLGLGLLLQRAAGAAGPDPAAWAALIHRIVASFGDAPQGGTQ